MPCRRCVNRPPTNAACMAPSLPSSRTRNSQVRFTNNRCQRLERLCAHATVSSVPIALERFTRCDPDLDSGMRKDLAHATVKERMREAAALGRNRYREKTSFFAEFAKNPAPPHSHVEYRYQVEYRVMLMFMSVRTAARLRRCLFRKPTDTADFSRAVRLHHGLHARARAARHAGRS